MKSGLDAMPLFLLNDLLRGMAKFSPYSLIHPFLLLGVLCFVQSPPEQEEIHNLKQDQGVPIKKQHRILGIFPKTNQTGE